MLIKLPTNEIPTQTAFALNDEVGSVYYRKVGTSITIKKNATASPLNDEVVSCFFNAIFNKSI